jgi:hypothetical protein
MILRPCSGHSLYYPQSLQWPPTVLSSVLAVATACIILSPCSGHRLYYPQSLQWPPPGLSSVLAVATAWIILNPCTNDRLEGTVLSVTTAWMTASPCTDPPTILRLSLAHPYPLAVVKPACCPMHCTCQNMWEFTVSVRFKDRWCGERAH